MVDTELVAAAKECSADVLNIDSSWRSYLDEVKQNIFTLPFQENCSIQFQDGFVLIEAFVGELRITRLYYAKKTYALKTPLVQQDFRIFGVFDNSGRFMQFTSQPKFGFHYVGMSTYGHAICTGELRIIEPKFLETLQLEARKVAESFRIINMESLGKVFLPDEYAEFREVFVDSKEYSGKKVELLLNKGFIEELLKGASI